MKNSKIVLKLVLWGLVGGIIGFAGNFFMCFIKDTFEAASFPTLFLGNIIWIQIITALLGLSAAFFFMQKSRKSLHQMQLEDDEEDDELINKFEDQINKGMVFNVITFVLTFVWFGIGNDPLNPHIIPSVLVFLVIASISIAFDVMTIQLAQKNDPLKKGDPSSLKFAKDWINSCDEAEKIMVYKSAYGSFMINKHTLMFGTLIALMSKMTFDTGNFPIILMGVLWLTNNLSYHFYVSKYSKEKLL